MWMTAWSLVFTHNTFTVSRLCCRLHLLSAGFREDGAICCGLFAVFYSHPLLSYRATLLQTLSNRWSGTWQLVINEHFGSSLSKLQNGWWGKTGICLCLMSFFLRMMKQTRQIMATRNSESKWPRYDFSIWLNMLSQQWVLHTCSINSVTDKYGLKSRAIIYSSERILLVAHGGGRSVFIKQHAVLQLV